MMVPWPCRQRGILTVKRPVFVHTPRNHPRDDQRTWTGPETPVNVPFTTMVARPAASRCTT